MSETDPLLKPKPWAGANPGLWNQFRAIMPSVAYVGIQMGWAVQIGYVTPELEKLGMSTLVVPVAWLAGPISGIFMQPLIGAWSDRLDFPFGRRRVFIITGTALSSVAMLVTAFSTQICGSSDTGLIVLFLFMFSILDFSLNAAMPPTRALIADTCPEILHPFANACMSMNSSLGFLLGYGLGATSLTSLGLFRSFPSQFSALYTCTALVLVSTTAITCVGCPEERNLYSNSKPTPLLSWLALLPEKMLELPVPIKRAVAVQFCVFCSWFFLYIYGSTWMGSVIYGGSATGDDDAYSLYEDGVEAANWGYFGMACVGLAYSHVIPELQKIFGMQLVWAGNLCVMGGCFFTASTLAEGQKSEAIATMALLGIPYAATYQTPWSVVTCITRDMSMYDLRAQTLGIFNLAQCFPELLSAVLGMIVYYATGDIGILFKMAGAFSLLGAALCTIVIDPFHSSWKDESDTNTPPKDRPSYDQFGRMISTSPQTSPNHGTLIVDDDDHDSRVVSM